MLRASWSGFVERWTLFIGAAVTVCLGVALVQSSLLLLITAATMDPPAGLSETERMRFGESADGAVAVLGITLGCSAFLAVFIISSTFAFTVAQRRRDLALLRLVGAGRGHVYRLLLGEALLLGLAGVAGGVPAGLAMMSVQAWLLRRLRFVPDGFAGQWRGWILWVSAGVGIGLAVVGVLVAARRAARVRPLEALRDTGQATRVMTVARWGFGLLFAGGAVALVILAPAGGAAGGPAMAMNVSLCAAVALSVFAPLVVPAVARLIPGRLGGVLGDLAKANLRDGVRRTAATAAPLIVLVGVVLGEAGAIAAFDQAGTAQQRRDTVADMVVEGTGPIGPRVAAVPGVGGVSVEMDIPASVTIGSGDDRSTETTSALVIDPPAYQRTHPGSGDLSKVHGRAVASGPGGDEMAPGDTVRVRVPGLDLGAVPVAATVPPAMMGGAGLLLPAGLVPADRLAEAPSRAFVTLRPGADRARVAAALSTVGPVRTVDDWLARDAAARAETNTGAFVVVLGLGALYALIGVVNAVVVAAADRRRELAAARTAGLTRGQVVRAALVEACVVTAIGLMLGGAAAGATLAAAAATTAAVTGTGFLVVPWPLVGAVTAVAFLVTGVTSLLTSAAATRFAPITLLNARE